MCWVGFGTEEGVIPIVKVEEAQHECCQQSNVSDLVNDRGPLSTHSFNTASKYSSCTSSMCNSRPGCSAC